MNFLGHLNRHGGGRIGERFPREFSGRHKTKEVRAHFEWVSDMAILLLPAFGRTVTPALQHRLVSERHALLPHALESERGAVRPL
jgi:hypothetical protein